MDGVNEAETRVVVRVRDVNDLPPTFLQNSYDAVIFEESITVFDIVYIIVKAQDLGCFEISTFYWWRT